MSLENSEEGRNGHQREKTVNENRVMIYIVYDRAIEEEVIDMLEETGLPFYTKWKDVVGVGVHDPHLGDHIWPGLNNVVMIATDRNGLHQPGSGRSSYPSWRWFRFNIYSNNGFTPRLFHPHPRAGGDN